MNMEGQPQRLPETPDLSVAQTGLFRLTIDGCKINFALQSSWVNKVAESEPYHFAKGIDLAY
jgi:hypothetical protein